MAKRTPSYRRRKGYNQAIVTLRDSVTGFRRDSWLGEYDSPESREQYHRDVAEWEANGRRLIDPTERGPERGPNATTVAEVLNEAINANLLDFR